MWRLAVFIKDMEERETDSGSPEGTGNRYSRIGAPMIFVAFYVVIGLFFVRPDMGDPDSYREAISAIQYIEEGTYGSYWDHPLTMYFFVAATRLAFAFGWDQLAVLNVLAVLLSASTVWPLYQLISRLAGWRAAAFASAAYILSPALIRFTTYLTHEGVGFAFALWSIYLFERALSSGGRTRAFAFGVSFGATWAARPNAAVFIALPLLTLLVHDKDALNTAALRKLFLFAFLGFFACLLPIYRPALISRLVSRSGRVMSAHYDFGWYAKSTTMIAIESLTPVLLALSAAGAAALLAFRKRLVGLFAAIWVVPVYLFYTGILCRHRYFLILLPPCILMIFAGADRLDERFRFGREKPVHAIKLAALLLLVFAGLVPSLPELLYIRKSSDDALVAKGIGQVAGGELLFTTSLKPMINYYNRGNPPETVYLITELKPGTLKMNGEALNRAQLRLRTGRPVYATGLILEHFKHLNIDVGAEPVWEYKSQRLYRLTRIDLSGVSAGRY